MKVLWFLGIFFFNSEFVSEDEEIKLKSCFDGSSLDLMVFHDPKVYFVLKQSKG